MSQPEVASFERDAAGMRAMIVDAGIDATVFERAREIKEVGAGILLSANAVSTLGEIGQIENPLLCRLRDTVLKATPTRTQLRQLDQVLRYEESLG
jgi:2-polyprenyl-6-methoxyphenol hydroxylase-like FAD-dependent oxidoreductase